MFYKFKKGEQKALIQKAIVKAGSEKKLAKLTKIPAGSIYALKFEKRNLSSNNAEKLCNYLQINLINSYEIQKLPKNWGQIKGGRNLIKRKIESNTLQDTIRKLKKASSEKMKQWHKNMKENEPEKYYKWQYERFKKIGKGYIFDLINGIKVRNALEKEVGDFLIKNFRSIKYEQYLNMNGKAYFPDFIYRNVIIEVTGWKHPDENKIKHLIEKINNYTQSGYSVCFFVPQIYRKFYKEIESHIISTLPELRDFIHASVA